MQYVMHVNGSIVILKKCTSLILALHLSQIHYYKDKIAVTKLFQLCDYPSCANSRNVVLVKRFVGG